MTGAAGPAAAPTGVGFCMAMSRHYLERVPRFDPAFGRGYGEEVDWCQRVRALGGRHLGLPGLFVEHRGGASFGSAEKARLVAANGALISARYPRYDAEVQAFLRDDPLATPRLALALAWAAAECAAGQEPGQGRALPVYLAHSMGGGAEQYLRRRIAAGIKARGSAGAAAVLRVGGPRRWQIEVHGPQGVTLGHTDDVALLARLLAPARALDAGLFLRGRRCRSADAAGGAAGSGAGGGPGPHRDAGARLFRAQPLVQPARRPGPLSRPAARDQPRPGASGAAAGRAPGRRWPNGAGPGARWPAPPTRWWCSPKAAARWSPPPIPPPPGGSG